MHRYGKVQSVKILPRNNKYERGTNNGTNNNGNGSVSATVAFIDIKSAAKAHSQENKIEERTLKTDYYEPPASSYDESKSAIYIHEREDALSVVSVSRPGANTCASVYSNSSSNANSRSGRHNTPSR